MAEYELPKFGTRIRFTSGAPEKRGRKMRDRGFRYAEEQRAKAKAFRTEKDCMSHCKRAFESPVVPDAKSIGIRAHSPKMCSCPMCGNARKWNKGKNRNTMQERREQEAEKED